MRDAVAGRAALDGASGAAGRLILTTSDAGAGHLKRAGIADRVVCIDRVESLVSGPVPPGADPQTFFAAREAAWPADGPIGPLPEWLRADAASKAWSEVIAGCERHDRVELWIDPDPNAQLHAIRALTWLRAHPAIVAKLWLLQADEPLGERSASHADTLTPKLMPVDDGVLVLAAEAWDAYRAATPERWAALLRADLGALPRLTEAVVRLLAELPASDTALGSSQRRALERIDARPTRFIDLVTWNAQDDPERVHAYLDFGAMVDDLARGDQPLIVGLPPGPFDLALHDDAARHRAYVRSPLSLSSLGRRLVGAGTDLAAHRRIERWWGGTCLANEQLWRWNATRAALIAPA